ncbi:MAG TPA: formylglycine-generating enzyme family protein [Anaerolineae bacterium]|nr:formylglycine-generating enzyme family protein [Anaerolineae bacterium]
MITTHQKTVLLWFLLTLIFPTACGLNNNLTDTATNTPQIQPTPELTLPPTRYLGQAQGFLLPNDATITRVWVPAGSFIMGSNDQRRDQKPAHEVYLDSYWLDQTEVTNQNFVDFLNEYPLLADWVQVNTAFSKIKSEADIFFTDAEDASYPVEAVAWYAAHKYCEWAGGRLPTEAEWEKGARGTTEWLWPWGNTFETTKLNCSTIDCADDGFDQLAPVGSFPEGASPYNAFDMAGNVVEWTADIYDSKYYESSPTKNPMNPLLPNSDDFGVLRGGSWLEDRNTSYVTYRQVADPRYLISGIGFRCVALPTN